MRRGGHADTTQASGSPSELSDAESYDASRDMPVVGARTREWAPAPPGTVRAGCVTTA